MKLYFILQARMLNRRMKDAGINPAIGYMLMLAAFIAASYYLFYRLAYAAYVYPLIPITLAAWLGGAKRNEFLQLTFPRVFYIRIRVLEQLVFTIPFVIFLLFRREFAIAAALPILMALMGLSNFRPPASRAIPTPFYKFPFEFAVGFRQSVLVILGAYALLIIAIFVNNFNLGIFALAGTLLTCTGFYLKPEPEFYVWIYTDDAKGFLRSKLKVAMVYTALLTLPISLVLIIFYHHDIAVILLVQVLGMLIVATALLSKYAYFPSEMGILQALALVFCIGMPLFIPIIIPLFYKRSVRRLNNILT